MKVGFFGIRNRGLYKERISLFKIARGPMEAAIEIDVVNERRAAGIAKVGAVATRLRIHDIVHDSVVLAILREYLTILTIVALLVHVSGVVDDVDVLSLEGVNARTTVEVTHIVSHKGLSTIGTVVLDFLWCSAIRRQIDIEDDAIAIGESWIA